jgi:hypothetical protein
MIPAYQRTYLNPRVKDEDFHKACGAVNALREVGIIGGGFRHSIIPEATAEGIEVLTADLSEEELSKGRKYSDDGRFGFIGLKSVGDCDVVDRVLKTYQFFPTGNFG